jgi:dimethylamine corrinoid protein
MTVDKEQLFRELSDAVVAMDEEKTLELTRIVVADRIDAYEAIEKGLSAGMERAGKLFEKNEYFVPELLICAEVMYAGLDLLKPHIAATEGGDRYRVVIGVIEGDTHDIGKNLVKIMLEASRFDVYDLGRDVAPSRFLEKAREVGAHIVAVSTLMTTTMPTMDRMVRLLKKENAREQFKVMVGGGPISQEFAERIGADGYAANAGAAVKLAKLLMNGTA